MVKYIVCQIIQGYPEQILKEINDFRRKQHYFPSIRWQNQLAGTGFIIINKKFLAGQEAQIIINKGSFGQHQNFDSWRSKIKNKYFTEFALKIDTQGQLPPKRIFAKTVLESLKQEKEWYLMHTDTDAGISMPQRKSISSKKNNKQKNYKKIDYKKKNYRPKISLKLILKLTILFKEIRSCKEAKQKGNLNEFIDIYPQGKPIKVKCDQKYLGGGWTRVADESKSIAKDAIFQINDLGLKYTELLFIAKPKYMMDYAKGNPANNVWQYNGYCFPYNGLRFDQTWYTSSDHSPYNKEEWKKIKHTTFNVKDKNVVEVIEPATKCLTGSEKHPEYCARKVLFKKLPQGRLNAFSDVQSIAKSGQSNNYWDGYYEIYLR